MKLTNKKSILSPSSKVERLDKTELKTPELDTVKLASLLQWACYSGACDLTAWARYLDKADLTSSIPYGAHLVFLAGIYFI